MPDFDHQGICNLCGYVTIWQDCPTGGWWGHDWPDKSVESLFKDPSSNLDHKADPGWMPVEEMDNSGNWNTVPTGRYTHS